MKKPIIFLFAAVFGVNGIFASEPEKEVRPQIFAPARTESSESSIKQESVAPAKEIRPAGMPHAPGKHHPPPPRFYHYHPYEYYPPHTTVIVYEQPEESNTVYVATLPDTIRFVNQFPVKFRLGIHGLFGPYAMTSDSWGYDFSGYFGGGGLMLQVPINETTMAFVAGALLTYRKADNTFDYYEDGKPTGESARYTFYHKNIDVPVLLRFRALGSRLSFDFGGKLQFNIRERLEIKDDSGKHTYDLDEERNLLNFALSLGFNIDLNQYISFNLGSDFAFGEMFNTSKIYGLPTEFTESVFSLGLTFNVF